MAAKGSNHPKVNYLIGLPDDVTVTNMVMRENCDEFFVSYKHPEQRHCPHCHSNNCIIKDAGRNQTVRHTPVGMRGTIISFHKQRLYCKDCRSTFFVHPEWLHPSLHMTDLLYITLCCDLTQMHSITTIAQNKRVTPSVVTSVLDTILLQRPSTLPVTLCVDEFRGSSGEWDAEKRRWDVNKYHCNIADGDAGIIFDILPMITAEFLTRYFRRFSVRDRDRVKYFCCDMHSGFISVAKQLFPKARVCIDMFHVVKLINDTVDGIRRRLQNDMVEHDSEKYTLLKGAARSLLSCEIKQELLMNPHNAQRLEKLKTVFGYFPELEEAYHALQSFHFINRNTPLMLKKADLTDWIADYANSNTPELKALALRIRYWRGYIHNAWQYERTNSVCEGLNNKIKVLKRISYGAHSFDSFRKRVLLTCGPIRLANDPFTIFQEKRKGKGIRL